VDGYRGGRHRRERHHARGRAGGAAGIPVVAIDAILPEDGPQPRRVGRGQRRGGARSRPGVRRLGNANGGRQIGVVGALNSFIQNVRLDGFTARAGGRGGRHLADTVDGQNVQDVALAAAENLITANPDMTASTPPASPRSSARSPPSRARRAGRRQGLRLGPHRLGHRRDRRGLRGGGDPAGPAGMGAAAVEALVTLSEGGTVERTSRSP
jgi:ribose transport system substrate-binding protein